MRSERATDEFFGADHAAHLVAGLRGAVENLAGARIGTEWLALDDAKRRQLPE
jgi:hypothetical protein